ncbi:hypothetical protein ABPG75_006006 [Micractinium tetrahymenae]
MAEKDGGTSRRRAPAPPLSGAAKDFTMIVGVWAHEGGTGKTTFATHLAAMLAKQGLKVILVDADAQLSSTTQFADASIDEEEDDSEGEESEEEELPAGAAAGSGAGPSGRLVLGPIPRDRLRKPDAMRPSAFQQILTWCEDKDNLLDVLKSTVFEPGFVA